MKNRLLPLVVAISMFLAACGGGGEGDAQSGPTPVNSQADVRGQPSAPTVISDTGAVDAPFVQRAQPEFILDGPTAEVMRTASSITQASNGAMIVLGLNSLSGDMVATQEISGNANYAQGRWNFGKVTGELGTVTLTATSSASFHYVVFNYLTALPTTGTMTCDSGKFTRPSYFKGETLPDQSGYLGTSSGAAGLMFDGSGAHVTLSVSTAVGSANGIVNLSGSISRNTATYAAGVWRVSGSGGLVTLGDAGSGAVFVITDYQVAVSNNNVYRGVATFTCR